MSSPLKATLKDSLKWLCHFFEESPARSILCRASAAPVLIFTDGASSDESVTVGAVMLCMDMPPETFGEEVPSGIVGSWRRDQRTQVIGQAELAPVILSIRLWADVLRGRHVIVFIDQDAARLGLVKAYSPSEVSSELIDVAMASVADVSVYPWFARVATASNIADLPSRFMWKELYDILPKVSRKRLGGREWSWLK